MKNFGLKFALSHDTRKGYPESVVKVQNKVWEKKLRTEIFERNEKIWRCKNNGRRLITLERKFVRK